MSWHWVLIALLFGIIVGYVICDLLTVESKITYYIKKLRAKEGGVISVEADATLAGKEKRRNRRKNRLNGQN